MITFWIYHIDHPFHYMTSIKGNEQKEKIIHSDYEHQWPNEPYFDRMKKRWWQ